MTDKVVNLRGAQPNSREFGDATLALIKATYDGVISYLETQKMPGPINSEMVRDYHRHLEEHSHSYKEALSQIEKVGASRSDDVAGLCTFFLLVSLASSALPRAMHSKGLEALLSGVIGMYEVPTEEVPPILMSILSNMDGVRVVQLGGGDEEKGIYH